MISHTCPHCGAQLLYAPDVTGPTHCRACGREFELSALTKSRPNAAVAAWLATGRALRRIRESTLTIYIGGGLLGLVLLWVVLSAFGLLPDAVRIVNRRYVSLNDWDRVTHAVGIAATGSAHLDGTIAFDAMGTAWAVSNDGFMLTNRHVISRSSLFDRIWVYLDHKRYDAELVATDSVADIALIKVNGYLPYRFRVASAQAPPRLNLPVSALGYQEMPADAGTMMIETPLATTQGQISRVYSDQSGTRWIEHTAAVKHGSSGGPLISNDVVIGINTKQEFGITSALDVAPFHEWMQTAIDDWRQRHEH